MQTFKATLTGTAPLIMHNERLANPRDPHTRALKELTSVRSKTDEVLADIQKTEWRGGLYEFNKRAVVPAANVLARKLKQGKAIASSVFSLDAFYVLTYDGPTDFEALYDDGRFSDYRSVGVNQSRVMRSRPIFPEWSIKISLEFDADVVTPEVLSQSLDIAGRQIGLCDHRPQYGRFVVS
jgi:hypothetical protein